MWTDERPLPFSEAACQCWAAPAQAEVLPSPPGMRALPVVMGLVHLSVAQWK